MMKTMFQYPDADPDSGFLKGWSGGLLESLLLHGSLRRSVSVKKNVTYKYW